ncbi:hypothetical protein M083_1419 [Bacteroides fragilis str. 3986 T(B)9]|uniref:Uncharacterized protein n=5 Tax=Bacteroides fragilis TaxID=817 RepID=A0A015XFH9_BACFG|nr:hypothetical protein M101_1383 [Bacteroides fragilis str. 1007-1-F \
MGISMKLGRKDRGYSGNCKKEREEIGYFSPLQMKRLS